MSSTKSILKSKKQSSSEKKNSENGFYFQKSNFKWMLIGLGLIALGYLLMLGPDANTANGKFDPNVWNEGIFSWVRIRLAPLLIIAGFCVEAYAILKK